MLCPPQIRQDTCVLDGASIGDNAVVCDSSLVMRAESIPADVHWGGVPSQPMRMRPAEPRAAVNTPSLFTNVNNRVAGGASDGTRV